MAEKGHYGGNPGSTRQGIYVCTSNGEFLASVNSNNPDRVLRMMREGLAAWERIPKEKRQYASDNKVTPRHRWEDSYPRDGLIVNVISRDLPANCDPTVPCEVKWNQDYVWFSSDEARSWLSDNPQRGDVHSLPAELIERLVRLHFVDNVKGQTSRFTANAVEGSEIQTEVVERVGPRVKLKITGETRGTASHSWWQPSHGVTTRVLGSAEFDLQENRFTEFEFVALGRRWGYTRFNGRRRDPESGPLGYVFRLADANTPPIAPAWISHYDADWVIRPTAD